MLKKGFKKTTTTKLSKLTRLKDYTVFVEKTQEAHFSHLPKCNRHNTNVSSFAYFGKGFSFV